jgi:hypothetical protein
MASSSSSIPIPQLAVQQIGLLFAVYSQVVVAGTYTKAGGGTVNVSMLVFPVNLALADGTIILPGDEKVLIQASELTSIANPAAGDTVTETASGVVRNVIVAQRDLTRQLWTFFARKE